MAQSSSLVLYFSFLLLDNLFAYFQWLANAINLTDHLCTGDGNLSVILGVAWREQQFLVAAVNSSHDNARQRMAHETYFCLVTVLKGTTGEASSLQQESQFTIKHTEWKWKWVLVTWVNLISSLSLVAIQQIFKRCVCDNRTHLAIYQFHMPSDNCKFTSENQTFTFYFYSTQKQTCGLN